MDAQERADTLTVLLKDDLRRTHGDGVAIGVLGVRIAEQIRRAELEATKITPEMIEATAEVLMTFIVLTQEKAEEISELALKAALGAK